MDSAYLLASIAVLCGSGLYAQAMHYKSKSKNDGERTPIPDLSPRLDKLEKLVSDLRGSVTQLQLKEGFKR